MNRFFLGAALLAFASASQAHAQGGGGGGGSSSGGGAAGGGGASSSSSGMSLNTNAIATNGSAGLATIGSQSTTGGSSSTQAVSTSNFLSGSYNNPYYPGRPNSTQLGIATGSGGFGTPSFGTTSTAIGGNGTTTGRAGSATATTGARAGGAAGGTSTATKYTGGSLGTANSQISYAAVLKFAVPPVDERQKQVDLQDSLKSTVSLENANSFQVSLDNGVVVVRGRAKDDEERRLVENILRLEPGVRDVRNQIEVK